MTIHHTLFDRKVFDVIVGAGCVVESACHPAQSGDGKR